MTPERWQQIKALLEAALEREHHEQVAFLDEACAGDPALRAQVDALLDSHARAGDFIEAPAYEVMARSLNQNELVAGRAVGPYQIIAALGSGGMGDIYLAADTRLGRKVVLKALPTHFTRDPERVHRFQLEARASSALNHPNIITIYDIGQLDQMHYIAIEFIDGETLRQRIKADGLKISEVLEIASNVTAALLAAHEAGIVHRDIKPENIMLRADGVVKVLDFGLAKLTESKPVAAVTETVFQTEQGIVMGTAPYMSPEQTRGFAVDPRTDIWSLGAVLYEMIAGQPPFQGPTSIDVMVAILGSEPVPLVRHRPEVPTELEWIVKKTLRKDRDERYQTAKELLADLRNLSQRLNFEAEVERSLDTADTRILDRVVQIERPSQARRLRTIDSLAILPWLHNFPDESMEYFSDGISESIINTLSELADLRVMAWSTVMQYKGRQLDPRQIGRELGVSAVLTGRLLQSANNLFVMKLEMVDVSDGSHLWAYSCTCNSSQILEIETGICREVSEKLLLRLTSEERKQLAKRPTDNVEAYHSYLKGRYCWNKRTADDVKKAVEYFAKAIDADPAYALAYAGLADAHLILGSFGVAAVAPKESFPKAREAVERALELDDTLAEAHATLAFCLACYDWDWKSSEREFKRALELKPGYATAHHWYGFIYLAAMGRLDEAIAEVRRANELDPLALPVASNIGLLLYVARRYDEALEQFHRNLDMDSRFVYTHWEMALTYEQCGQYDQAIAAFEKAIALSGKSVLPRVLLARTYALAGRKSEATALLDVLSELPARTYVSPYRMAAVHAALGDKDRAFKWLEHAYDGHDGWLIWLAVDPVVDSLRDDPRFDDLLNRLGLDGRVSGVQRPGGALL